jgi:hypothetical protein
MLRVLHGLLYPILLLHARNIVNADEQSEHRLLTLDYEKIRKYIVKHQHLIRP